MTSLLAMVVCGLATVASLPLSARAAAAKKDLCPLVLREGQEDLRLQIFENLGYSRRIASNFVFKAPLSTLEILKRWVKWGDRAGIGPQKIYRGFEGTYDQYDPVFRKITERTRDHKMPIWASTDPDSPMYYSLKSAFSEALKAQDLSRATFPFPLKSKGGFVIEYEMPDFYFRAQNGSLGDAPASRKYDQWGYFTREDVPDDSIAISKVFVFKEGRLLKEVIPGARDPWPHMIIEAQYYELSAEEGELYRAGQWDLGSESKVIVFRKDHGLR